MNNLAEDIMHTANSFAENFNDRGSFDYSLNSLDLVEELLDEMSDYILDDDDVIYNASVMAGSYIFETARRNFGGEYLWDQQERQPVLVTGRPDFSVAIKAWEKARGRIINGTQDNIPFYIDGLKQAVERGRAQKGYTATIL